jgi:hypothetical protein
MIVLLEKYARQYDKQYKNYCGTSIVPQFPLILETDFVALFRPVQNSQDATNAHFMTIKVR